MPTYDLAALIFDVDGTLCDTGAVDADCFSRACGRALGVPSHEIEWLGAPEMTDSSRESALMASRSC